MCNRANINVIVGPTMDHIEGCEFYRNYLKYKEYNQIGYQLRHSLSIFLKQNTYTYR